MRLFLLLISFLFITTFLFAQLKNPDAGKSNTNVSHPFHLTKYSGSASSPQLLWVKQLATHLNSGTDAAMNSVVDKEGNSYITGNTTGLGTESDFTTVKIDTTGTVCWKVRHDGPLHIRDEASGIALDSSGNVYVSGLQNGNDASLEITTQKINASGVEEWVKSFPFHGQYFYWTRIAVDHNSNVYVAGYDYNVNKFQMTLLRYAPDGTERWHILIDSTSYLSMIATDDNNNVYVIGGFGIAGQQVTRIKKIDSTGTLLWSKFYPTAINVGEIDRQGNLFVTGKSGPDIYTAKINPLGTILWEKTQVNSVASSGSAITLDEYGNVYISALPAEENWNILVLKYDSSGNKLWSHTYSNWLTDISNRTNIALNTTGNEVFVSVYSSYYYLLLRYGSDSTFLGINAVPGGSFMSTGFDGSGNFYAAGGYYEDSAQNIDYGVAKFSSAGIQKGLYRFEDHACSYDWAAGMMFDETGNIYVAGHSSVGDYSRLTLWKLDPSGNELWRSIIQDSASSISLSAGIARDSLGNIVLIGSKEENATGSDYAIIKVTPGGDILWTKYYSYYTGAIDEKPSSLAIDPLGNIYVTGNGASLGSWPYDYGFLTVKLSPEGSVLWSHRFDGNNTPNTHMITVQIGNDAGIYVAGTSRGSDGLDDFVMIRYDSLGNQSWSTRYDSGNSKEEELWSTMVLDDSSNVICAGSGEVGHGSISNPTDFLLTKTSATTGALSWVARFDTTIIDEYYDVKVDHAGNIVGVGKVWWDGSGLVDYAVLKYNSSGQRLWVNATADLPTQRNDEATQVNFDEANNIYVLGQTYLRDDNRNIDIVKYTSNGEQVWGAMIEGMYYGDDQPNVIAVDHGSLYVLETNTFSGSVINLIKMSLEGTLEIKGGGNDITIPKSLTVDCWPNPFNSTITISYALPKQTKVSIKFYNVLGQEVDKFADEIQSADHHTIRWSPTSLPSGMYFCRVSTETGSSLAKLFLLK